MIEPSKSDWKLYREKIGEWQEHYKEMKKYVKSLSKTELQEQLPEALLELEERRNYW